jgi:hypothetical protein
MERMTDSVKVLTRWLVEGIPIHSAGRVRLATVSMSTSLVSRGANRVGSDLQMSSSTDSRSVRYCRFVSTRAGTILLAALMLFAVAAFLASKLELKTAISELLPSDDPGVVALEKTQKRLGDMSLLLVGIRSPDRDANLRYADALTESCRPCRSRRWTWPPTISATSRLSSKVTSGSTSARMT